MWGTGSSQGGQSSVVSLTPTRPPLLDLQSPGPTTFGALGPSPTLSSRALRPLWWGNVTPQWPPPQEALPPADPPPPPSSLFSLLPCSEPGCPSLSLHTPAEGTPPPGGGGGEISGPRPRPRPRAASLHHLLAPSSAMRGQLQNFSVPRFPRLQVADSRACLTEVSGSTKMSQST